MRKSTAAFPDEIASAIQNTENLANQLISILLAEYFPQTIHDEILARIGLDRSSIELVNIIRSEIVAVTKRAPAFRNQVLRAYEHKCAVTGFRAAMGGTFFGCEAAHVKWHAYEGPDSIANGICLEPTLHKLFDAGAWTLSDNHRILVSQEYTGSETALARLRDYHGKPLSKPISGESLLSEEYIRWHREPELGGVFRTPALEL